MGTNRIDKVSTKKFERNELLIFSWILSNTGSSVIEYYVALNISLNATERLELVNGLFNKNVNINSSYALTVHIIINNVTSKLGKFSDWTKRSIIFIDLYEIV